MASAQTSKKTSGKQSASGKTAATTKKQAAAGGARSKTGTKTTASTKKSTASTQKRTTKSTQNKSRNTSASNKKNAGRNQYTQQELIERNGMYDEVKMIVSLAVSILFLVSTLGFGGKLGGYVSIFLFGVFGWMAYVLPYCIFFGTAFCLSNKRSNFVWKKVLAFILFVVCLMALLQMLVSPFDAATKISDYYKDCSVYKNGGGIIGGTVCHFLVPYIGKICTYVLLIICMMLGIVFMAQKAVFTVLLEKIKDWADESREYREERKSIKEEMRRQAYEEQLALEEQIIKEKEQARKSRYAQKASAYEDDDIYSEDYDDDASDFAGKRSHASEKRSTHQPKHERSFDELHTLPEDFKLADVDIEEPVPVRAATELSDADATDAAGLAALDAIKETQNKAPQITVTRMAPIRFEEDISEDTAADVAPSFEGVSEHTMVLDSDTVVAAQQAYEDSLQNEVQTASLDEDGFMPPDIDEAFSDNTDRAFMRRLTDDDFDSAAGDNSTGGIVEGSQPQAAGTPVKTIKKATAAETVPVTEEEIKAPVKEYVFPPIDLLKRGKPKTNKVSDSHLQETAMKLQNTLDSFGVKVQVTNVSCGPSVTRYELTPDQGVKVSKIVALSDDIKLNLAVSDIRIEAPIPGKAAVGIEVPNKENTTVMLRDLIESVEFQKSKANLSFAVGQDIGGQVIVTDIAKMPHVLIAGATGSGKSVCINTMIMSIIYKAKPEDVRLIMIDPKVVELSVYNGIPHLLIPVVTDPKKAAGALNWAVTEMTDRYQKFAELGVRDIKGYNAKIEASEYESETYKKMPQIVIIVDELADLMMVSSSEVEDAICRLAQLARAAGIHLVIATQRPSVNVITGIIKANIPSRIAFSVSSGVDSRTIIDMNGAEKLLGKGDMLFYPADVQKPKRVQGAFVTDEEVNDVVEFLKAENGEDVQYSSDIESKIAAAKTPDGASAAADRDVYFADAGRFIIEKDKASIGMLQRVYKIGFNRAARIMDQLADAGVVGPEEGTKPRKVLMSAEEFEDFVENYV